MCGLAPWNFLVELVACSAMVLDQFVYFPLVWERGRIREHQFLFLLRLLFNLFSLLIIRALGVIQDKVLVLRAKVLFPLSDPVCFGFTRPYRLHLSWVETPLVYIEWVVLGEGHAPKAVWLHVLHQFDVQEQLLALVLIQIQLTFHKVHPTFHHPKLFISAFLMVVLFIFRWEITILRQ